MLPEVTSFASKETIIDIFLIVYGGILAFGAIMCSLMVIILYRGRIITSQWPFFRIVQSLLFIDIISLLVQIGVVYPSMIMVDWGIGSIGHSRSNSDTGNTWYNSKIVRAGLSVFDFLPMKGLLYHSLLMAMNRLAVFSAPSIRAIFDKDSIKWIIVGCWALILSFSTLSALVRPTQRFNQDSLRFERSGEIILNIPALKLAITILDYVIPVFVIAVYIVIYYSIKKKRRMVCSTTSKGQARTHSVEDRRLLWQALIIAVLLQLCNIACFVSEIVDHGTLIGYILNIVALIFAVTNHSTNSTIFIFTNSTLRNLLPRPALLQRIRCKTRQPRQYSNEEKYAHENSA